MEQLSLRVSLELELRNANVANRLRGDLVDPAIRHSHVV